ncbi:DNA-directed RNA polymerase III complex subunit Rpc25 [Thecaphora frezii]
MFVLSEIEDTIAVHPNHFGMPTIQAVSDQINRKFANKILQDVGLCVSLFDISSCSEGKVRWGDGFLYHKVVFRLIVFRPFVNQVLVGKIKSSDENGIRVTMGFFDDIYIPAHLIPNPSAFDHQERAFFWLFEARTPQIAEDPLLSAPEERMYLDPGELIRFSVESDQFFDAEPGPPTGEAGAAQGMDPHNREVIKKDTRPHYSLTCSIMGQGLGLVSWWAGAEQTVEAGTQEEVYDYNTNQQAEVVADYVDEHQGSHVDYEEEV